MEEKKYHIIAVDNRELFEQRLDEAMKKGYKVKFTNMSITNRGGSMGNIHPIITCFYAYMEKE